MNKTESQILAEVLESTRFITRFYLSQLKGTNQFNEFEVEGRKLNSWYWILGHLTWSENLLGLKLLNGPAFEVDWLPGFKIGNPLAERKEGLPDLKELFALHKDVHLATIEHINSLPDEELNEDNESGVSFDGDASKRQIIHHVIRHESIHTGQLGWLCKLFGIETI